MENDDRNRWDDLSRRLQSVEDRLAIGELLARHAPAADAPWPDHWTSLWTEDGELNRLVDTDGGRQVDISGVDRMGSDLTAPALERVREQGMAHVNTVPAVSVDGDRATAINYTVLVTLRDSAPRLGSVVVNTWHLRREGGGWRFRRRTTRRVGGVEARRLLADGLGTEVPDLPGTAGPAVEAAPGAGRS